MMEPKKSKRSRSRGSGRVKGKKKKKGSRSRSGGKKGGGSKSSIRDVQLRNPCRGFLTEDFFSNSRVELDSGKIDIPTPISNRTGGARTPLEQAAFEAARAMNSATSPVPFQSAQNIFSDNGQITQCSDFSRSDFPALRLLIKTK